MGRSKNGKISYAGTQSVSHTLVNKRTKETKYLLLDERPNDASHLVTVHFNNRIIHLDLHFLWLRYSNAQNISENQSQKYKKLWPNSNFCMTSLTRLVQF
jgi:hypothetical protein